MGLVELFDTMFESMQTQVFNINRSQFVVLCLKMLCKHFVVKVGMHVVLGNLCVLNEQMLATLIF